MQPNITGRSWLMVAALGLVWGATFPVIELTLEEFTPFWLAAGRVTFGAFLTTAIWIAMGGRLFDSRPSREDRINLLAIGVMSTALPFMLISWGQNYVTAGFAGVSMASVALIGVVRWQLLALCLVLLAVYWLYQAYGAWAAERLVPVLLTTAVALTSL